MATSTGSSPLLLVRTVEEVCNFLRERSVARAVVERFRHEKMDSLAVQESTVDVLKDMGLLKRGDIVSLKTYCTTSEDKKTQIANEEEQRAQKKRKLLADILQKSSSKKKKTEKALDDNLFSEKPEKKKVVQAGWMHFDQSKKKYITMRLNKGGGTRNIEVAIDADRLDVIDAVKSVFFPEHENCHGKLADMYVSLGDFTGKEITSNTFTLNQYIKDHKLLKPKLYILTKKYISTETTEGEESDSSLETTPLDDFDLLEQPPTSNEAETPRDIDSGMTDQNQNEEQTVNFPFDYLDDNLDLQEQPLTNNQAQTPRYINPDLTDHNQHSEETVKVGRLIGTIEQRVTLKEEQDKQYEEALRIDQAKCRRENVMKARAKRVPAEPNEGSQDVVTVSVRHITLGNIRRNFDKHDTASAVYDWVGSLSPLPEQFLLSTHAQEVTPSMPVSLVHNTVLYMAEQDESPKFPDDEDIQFNGFGQLHNQDDTVCNAENPLHVYEPPLQIPDVLLQDDVNVDLTPRVLRIHRVTVLKDMIQAFQDESLMASRIKVVVLSERGEEEMGVDDGGVFRDILSAFWERFYDGCTVGEDERVPSLRHDFSKDDWASVARILVKGFKDLKFFPFKLSKIVLAVALYGEEFVTSDMLLSSFKAYVAQDERDLISAALECSLTSEESEDWQKFLDRFSCKRIPKNEKADVESLLLEVAHKELIQTCRYVTDSWKPLKVLFHFQEFNSLSALCDLYNQVQPTNKKVLQLFVANPLTSSQRDTFAYLQRYIRGLAKEKLLVFLRYCTGATVLCVSQVRVDFTSDEGLGRRPVAHTCGPSLQLPTTYDSFPEFREEFNAVLDCGYWNIDIA